jgi:ketosteroid isomerase-like protein
MMDRTVFEALLDKLYEDRVADNVEGVMSCFHPDAAMRMAGSPFACPAAAAAKGAANVRLLIEGLVRAWEFLLFERRATVIDGDRAAVHSRLRVRFRPTGEEVETELYDLWTIRDGKIANLLEFADTALINAVVAKMQPAEAAEA